LREKVAIKIEDTTKNPIQISVLKNETRVLEYLARNGCRTQIPQVFWYGKHEDNICLIMTYFVGNSLEMYNQPSFQCIYNWIISSIDILEKIHFYGVIHRDIKPAHFIFVEEKQKWVLIDFGFATFYSENSPPINPTTNNYYITGTPNYISLNIHNGFKYKPIDDIWALVYIFIRMLYPELFVVVTNTNNTNNNNEEYPTNHILHSYNQLLKQRKELFVYPEFWEKFFIQKEESKEREEEERREEEKIKLLELFAILSSSASCPYKKIRTLFCNNTKTI